MAHSMFNKNTLLLKKKSILKQKNKTKQNKKHLQFQQKNLHPEILFPLSFRTTTELFQPVPLIQQIHLNKRTLIAKY